LPEPSPPLAADELSTTEATGAQRRPWALALLLIPIAAVIWPPLFNRVHPALGGLPFFVWYQLTAVVLGGVVTGVVYLLRGTERETEASERDGGPDDSAADGAAHGGEQT
jgi:Protein of unknown function (DUF3311)